MTNETRYTLNDKIFRAGLVAGFDGQEVQNGKKLLVVGGAAVQLLMGESDLLRPTKDIDYISSNYTSKSEKKAWANYVAGLARLAGYPAQGQLNRYGAIVKFQNLDLDFLLSFDTYGKDLFRRHEKRFAGEFERAVNYSVRGKLVRAHSPMDIILNKLRRISALERLKGLRLDDLSQSFVYMVKEAQFDDVDTSSLRSSLDAVLKLRGTDIEDLARLTERTIMADVHTYKASKDIYDITAVIEACRKMRLRINPNEFKEAKKLALSV